MKTTKILFLLLMIIATSNVCIAQYTGERANNYNSDYNRERREVQKNYEKQADLNRQPNAPSTRTNSGFTEAEAEQINNEWNRIWGKSKPSAEETAKRDAELREGTRRYEEEREADRQRWRAEEAQLKQDAKPYNDLLLQNGLQQAEAKSLSEKYINQKKWSYGRYGKEGHDFNAESIEAVKSLSFFNQNYQTADFNALKLCIDKLVEFGATQTAIKLIDRLVAKYPNFKEETTALQNKKYKMMFSRYSITTPSYNGESKKDIDDYFAFEAKNPKINLAVLEHEDGTATKDAYEIVFEYYANRAKDNYGRQGKIKREDREDYEKLIFQELKIKAINGLSGCKQNPYQLLLDEKKSNSNLFRRRYYGENNNFTFIGYGNALDLDFGVATYVDGRLFYGGFGSYGSTQGKCIYIYKNKAFYEGYMDGVFSNPTKKGTGKVTFPNGFYVFADFKKDIPTNAKYFNATGSSISKEDFEKQCGPKSAENAKSYVPQNGYALVEYTLISYYQGNFENGQRSGKGLIVFENGNSYEGDFLNNEPNGNGVYKYKDMTILEGNFVNGYANGTGKQTWPDGTTYVGEFKDFQLHGKGKVYLADGSLNFEGEHFNSKKIGAAKLYFNDTKENLNITYNDAGQWVNGSWTFTKTSKYKKIGAWYNNKWNDFKYYDAKGNIISEDEYNKN